MTEFLPEKCRGLRHVLDMPGLRLQSPTISENDIAQAGASDPEAQRWLEWPGKDIVPAGERERLLSIRPDDDQLLPDPYFVNLVAIDPAAGLIAGMVSMGWENRDIGGYLAPAYRGRGLGKVLFAGAAQLAHDHLGIKAVCAGTHPGNAACIGALTAAGFVPVAGPLTHAQPNGRVIPARWFRHERGQVGHCGRRGR
jgi:RimJ/RimL family protein N-acetyltransferase